MPNIKMADQPSGGGVDYLDLRLKNQLENYDIKSLTIPNYAFINATALKNVTFTSQDGVQIGSYAFQDSGIGNIHLYNDVTVGGNAFQGCASLKTVVVESFMADTNTATTLGGQAFRQCGLEIMDIGQILAFRRGLIWTGSSSFQTLILRQTTLVQITDATAFNGSPFASGGTGGTIYIPKALYDHLGDGTSLDYKAATNWATLDGYGTITWAKIEGSAYDGYWADGTPITT